MKITQKEKDDLVLLSHINGATLDSIPAYVMGRFNPFATIGQVGSALMVKYSWAATKRIMNNGGAFTS